MTGVGARACPQCRAGAPVLAWSGLDSVPKAMLWESIRENW